VSREGPLALWLCAVAAAPFAFAQTPAPPAPAAAAAPRIAWESDFDAALRRAQAEKKPLFVAFLMDDEPANDQTIKEHYVDPEIVELSRRFVCLVCCIGEHRGEDGGCTKFPGITCAQHQAIEKKARARWMVGDTVCTPQHVFCDGKGDVVLRKVYLISKATLAKCLTMTLHATGGDTSNLPKAKVVDDDPQALVDKEKAQVDGWLRDLDSRNLELREAALRGLGYADDARALPAVLARCAPQHDDPTRIAAIGALARKGNFEAVRPLAAMLKEPKAPIVIRVAQSLETIQMPEAVPPLLAAIKKERRDRVLGVLLRAAARSQSGNAEVREACLRAFKDASTQLESAIMVALGRLDAHPKIVELMVKQLESRNQNTRGLAAWVLGAQATPEARKALEALDRAEKTPEVRKLLASALKQSRGETVQGYDSMFWTFYAGSDF
jgi:HEAT repeat protein